MPQHFLKEIEHLKKKILHLTAMVEENLLLSVRSVTERNLTLAETVIENDVQIDRMEVEVEEECLKTLALYQPVAIDLRFIVAVMKINNDLERIGDEASNIAQCTTELALFPRRDVPFDLNRMLAMAVSMVKRSADAMISLDAGRARDICRSDDEMDEMYHKSRRVIYDQVRKEPDAVEYFSHLLSVSRSLERIGDHATNIAEDVIYMVDGEIVRHQGHLAE